MDRSFTFSLFIPSPSFSISKLLIKRSTSFLPSTTILSSNEIHSSLTIDRFSQSWRPESTHNRGIYLYLSHRSIRSRRERKKEQEKTSVEHRVPSRLRASFHHRVRKTKNTGPFWWRADGGKEVAQAPLLHRRWVKASG